MGSLLLTAGTPGLRHALPHARVMVHQPHGGARVCYLVTLCYAPKLWGGGEGGRKAGTRK